MRQLTVTSNSIVDLSYFICAQQELKKLHPHLTEEDVATLAAARIQEEMPHDHLWYRINATRSFGGSHKLTPGLNEKLHDVIIKQH